MLPLPASLASFDRAKPTLRNTRRLGGSFQAFSRDVFRLQFFLARSRITNLGVAILVALLLISASANLKYATRGSSVVEREHDFAEFLEEDSKSKKQHSFSEATPSQVVPPSIEETISEASRLRGATHLVVVAGHAIWNGCDAEAWKEDKNWVLYDYQQGQVGTFYSHIVRGAEIAVADPSAVLIFSGGVTRPSSPSQSEAQSYLRLALDSELLKNRTHIAFAEDYALDSFQNLLFSVARFHEVVNGPYRWPEKITVVGFEMKRRRFEELHRKAIRWPKSKFQYVGVDVVGETARAEGWKGEEKNGYLPYVEDLYGCHGALQAKRRSRNPFARVHPYYTSTPLAVQALLNWCPGGSEEEKMTTIFPGSLPWDVIP